MKPVAKPAKHRDVRARTCCLATGLALSDCTLLGGDYESSSTEHTATSTADSRMAAMESRLERLERKIDAPDARSR